MTLSRVSTTRWPGTAGTSCSDSKAPPVASTVITFHPSVPASRCLVASLTSASSALAKSLVGPRFLTSEGKLKPGIASSCGLTFL